MAMPAGAGIGKEIVCEWKRIGVCDTVCRRVCMTQQSNTPPAESPAKTIWEGSTGRCAEESEGYKRDK